MTYRISGTYNPSGRNGPVRATLLAMLALLFGLATPQPSTAAEGQPTVYATTYPVAWMVETLTDGQVTVLAPPNDADLGHWSPTAEDVLTMQQADLILMIGNGYEGWRMTVSLPDRKIHDLSSVFPHDALIRRQGVTHRHGPQGQHSHSGLVGHMWLNPVMASTLAGEVANALIGAGLADHAALASRQAALATQLAELDAGFQAATDPLRGTTVLASHPVYPYFAQHYGFGLNSLHLEPETPLSEGDLAQLATAIDTTSATVMLWEGPPADNAARLLAEKGVAVVIVPSLESPPEQGDYLTGLQTGLDHLRAWQAAQPHKQAD